jgi:hypothetical protein
MSTEAEKTPPSGEVLMQHEGFSEARVPESTSLEAIRLFLNQILEACATLKPPRLLVNMSALKITLSTTERYDIGMLGSRLAPHVQRVAVLASAPLIDREKFGVMVASNRGLTVDIFSDRTEALAWLLAEAGPKA